MSEQIVLIGRSNRAALVERGRRLEYFTIAYNSLEGLVAIFLGLLAGSIALVGFGFDSAIEVTSGAALLWRLRLDADAAKRERAPSSTQRTQPPVARESTRIWAIPRRAGVRQRR